jgi:hypothetical protein
VTALLFYFGWVYTNTRALYFGIDSSIFGYSIQDYILRSVDVIFVPMGVLLVTGMLLLGIHSNVSAWMRKHRRGPLPTLLRGTLLCGGTALIGAGIAGLTRHPVLGGEELLPPLFFGLGTLSVAYGVHLHHRYGPTAEHRRQQQPTLRSTYQAVVFGLVTLSLFWMMGDWAKMVGWGRAERLRATLNQRPGVTVYAKEALDIEPRSGVEADPLPNGGTYHFRYRGLKLLIRSGNTYFLVPSGWDRTDGVVILLSDSDHTRVELSPQ